ncbi:VWFA and cache domain-containing protein 1-like isoform X2 [Oscarella lobularis]|uniref:VWFA and cache domain-containing protein 1-like isoform X2 n=1 Tax=Oscarella lobularis TaxID=121494 RepID=UPI00331437CB
MLLVVCGVLCCASVLRTSAQSADAFQTVLSTFADDGLGVNRLQSKYDGLSYRSAAVDAQATLLELSGALDQKFQSRKAIALGLKYEAERLLAQGTNNALDECCFLSENRRTYDSRFSDDVDLNGQCNRLTATTDNAQFNVGENLVSMFKSNLQSNPTLKWQYFASQEGLISIYPAFKVQDCGSYDPRFRPWYVSASVPEPKDVVLVIDKSGSMTSTVTAGRESFSSRMELAKEAAKTVLDSLSPDDRVGVVAFSTVAEYPSGCYSNRLARATVSNVDKLKTYVDNLLPSGSTNYKDSLVSAFDLFIQSPSRSDENLAHKVILFLTDGEPTNSLGSNTAIMQAIRDKNQVLGFKVVILTYGMGDGIQSSGETLLRKIAEQDYEYYGVVSTNLSTAGVSDIVRTDSNIRQELGSYYSFFEPDAELIEPLISVPYYDLFGLGLVLTISVPVYSTQNGKRGLAGVMAIDIALADLVSDITFFRRDEVSYAFIIDSSGVTLTHPLLPVPTNVKEAPTYIDILTLEHQTVGFDEIRTSMLNGSSGSRVLYTQWTVPLGDSKMEGVRLDSIQAQYNWQPISGTTYSLCLVVARDFTTDYSLSPLSTLLSSYLYHRFDLIPPTQSKCSQFGRLAVFDDASVKISPEGFKDPFAYLDLEQTTSQANEYVSYFTGRRSNTYFNPTVRDSLATIHSVVSKWLQANDFTNFIVWRYVGTEDGAFIVLPGLRQVKEFDHLQRPWYKRTIANKGDIVLSSPYVDGFGAGYVITLSHTILSGRGENPQVMAVAAMDFTIPFMWTELTRSMSQCQNSGTRCVLIDNAGFVVIHPDFVDPRLASENGVDTKHITEMEKDLAASLVNRNIMIKSRCNDFQKKTVNVFWKVKMSSSSQSVSGSVAYDIYKVSQTNTFLIVSTRWSSSSNCYCDITKPLGSRTCQLSGAGCECPCSRPLSYNECEGVDSTNDLSIPVCPPSVPPVALAPQESDATAGLTSCFNIDCKSKRRKSDCFGVVGCEWCSYDYTSRSTISSPYCDDSHRCPLGSRGLAFPSAQPPLDHSTDKPSDEGESSPVIGIVVGVTVTVAVVIVVVLAACCRHKSNHTTVRTTTSHSQPQPSTSVQMSKTKDPYPSSSQPPPPSHPSAPPPPAYNEAVDLSPGGNLLPSEPGYPPPTNPYPTSAPYPQY